MALRNDDADDGVSLVTAVQRLFALEVAAAATVEADADEGEAAAASKGLGEVNNDLKDKKAAGR